MESRKKDKHRSLAGRAFTAMTMLALTASLVTATYAWFTSNTRTSTEILKARTGTDTLELQISTDGVNFRAEDKIAIRQVNKTASEKLLPVSTADLKTFVWNQTTVNDVASTFQKVENEAGYYHGRVYLKAVARGEAKSGKMRLYLDQGSETGGNIAQKTSGEMLNAARLGLSFGNAGHVIFRLSDEANRAGKRSRNTKVGGQLLGDNEVLAWNGNGVRRTADPAKDLSEYTITVTDAKVTVPKSYLCEMELNQSYPIDVYFYLEGCDPDCTDSISLQKADLHLAFYGVMTQE
ncbi:MAG: hypothetical protein Q4B59_00735 [Lachnospiraceae bacterium]|nr:hypothetical protein [Lachnospiraceae bacterium]